jgi:hypothetical protein
VDQRGIPNLMAVERADASVAATTQRTVTSGICWSAGKCMFSAQKPAPTTQTPISVTA